MTKHVASFNVYNLKVRLKMYQLFRAAALIELCMRSTESILQVSPVGGEMGQLGLIFLIAYVVAEGMSIFSEARLSQQNGKRL
jgi:hypothetical protein